MHVQGVKRGSSARSKPIRVGTEGPKTSRSSIPTRRRRCTFERIASENAKFTTYPSVPMDETKLL